VSCGGKNCLCMEDERSALASSPIYVRRSPAFVDLHVYKGGAYVQLVGVLSFGVKSMNSGDEAKRVAKIECRPVKNRSLETEMLCAESLTFKNPSDRFSDVFDAPTKPNFIRSHPEFFMWPKIAGFATRIG
jgi:hypothetical protein